VESLGRICNSNWGAFPLGDPSRVRKISGGSIVRLSVTMTMCERRAHCLGQFPIISKEFSHQGELTSLAAVVVRVVVACSRSSNSHLDPTTTFYFLGIIVIVYLLYSGSDPFVFDLAKCSILLRHMQHCTC
jgi:hypothetical protein